MSDDSEQLGPRARSLVETGRAIDAPSDVDRMRVRTRLTAALGVSALSAAAGTHAAAAGIAAEGATASTGSAIAGGSVAGAGAASGGAAAAGKTAAASGGLWAALTAKGVTSFLAAAAVSASIATVVLRSDESATDGSVQAPQRIERHQSAPSPAAAARVESAPKAAPAVPEPVARAPQPSAAALAKSPNEAQALPATASARVVPRDVRDPSAPTAMVQQSTRGAPRAPGGSGPVHDRASATPPAHAAATAPVRASAATAVTPVAPAAQASSNAPVAQTAAAAPKPAALSGELKLIANAQHALRDDELARALELLDEHAFRFPRGALRPERLAARAVVLCRMGEHAQGRAEAARLETEAPSSPLISWARSSCGL